MAGKQEVKLYGMLRSPFSRRVETALKLKGIPYDYVDEDVHNKSPELRKYNPVHKKVPVLVHNGKPIAESQVILEYIDETWQGIGYPLLPQDPYNRSMARFWAKFIDDKCLASAAKAAWGPEEEQEKALEEVVESLSVLEKEIQGKKFFGGERGGFVDIVGNVIAHWILVIQEAAGKEMLTKEKHPCLFEWSQEYATCSVTKHDLPPKDDLVDFFKIRIQASKS